VRAARAASVLRRTGLLAVEVVADLNDEIGFPPGDRGRHPLERPCCRVIAGLESVDGLEATARVP
jgi:hypothetical protein